MGNKPPLDCLQLDQSKFLILYSLWVYLNKIKMLWFMIFMELYLGEWLTNNFVKIGADRFIPFATSLVICSFSLFLFTFQVIMLLYLMFFLFSFLALRFVMCVFLLCFLMKVIVTDRSNIYIYIYISFVY